MTKQKKVVVKVGTSTLTRGTTCLSRAHMIELVRQIASIHEQGHEVILVSSGAIAAGREVLHHLKLDHSLPTKQMFAAVGQSQLMQVWSQLFEIYKISVGQVLLTRDDFGDRKRYLNIRNTMGALLAHKIIPIINENDTVATEEIKVGDNDNLSALIANLTAADLLVLLTDQEGLYTSDPRINPKAKLIPIVEQIDESVRKLAGGSSKKLGLGTGGMITKIEAADLASQSGTPTIIASAAAPNVLLRLVQGEKIGTLFLAQTTHRESRKQWLVSKKTEGTIHVDTGASSKLSKEGASLLPAGITKVTKNFDRGAIVQLLTDEEKSIAVGIVNYSSDEIKKLIGAQSSEIETLLGYSYGNEVIHRDNLVLIKTKGKE